MSRQPTPSKKQPRPRAGGRYYIVDGKPVAEAQAKAPAKPKAAPNPTERGEQ